LASGSELHKGHRQRLRDRAINEGLDAFNPHQVMELLLFYAIPVQDVSDLAHRLIDRFGSVKGVLNALPEELAEIKGVGKGVIEWMACLREMIDSYISLRPEDRPRLAN